jgi:hypothetical protein
MRILKTHVLLRLLNSYLVDSPQPANISYLWNFGVRPLKLYGYRAQSPSPFVYLTLLIALLIYILQYDTVMEANNFLSRIAIVQCTVKE